jgi:hypothetical protein
MTPPVPGVAEITAMLLFGADAGRHGLKFMVVCTTAGAPPVEPAVGRVGRKIVGEGGCVAGSCECRASLIWHRLYRVD